MRRLHANLPYFAKNFYFLLGIGFLVWMLLFDTEGLITQYRLWSKLKNLQAEKHYYAEQIEKIKKDREGLASNEALLEKFAREKYFMKKKTEDLYVIVEE